MATQSDLQGASIIDINGVSNLGTAILRATDGVVIQSTGELQGAKGDMESSVLYKMLLDTGAILQEKEPLRRISVSYSSHQYIAALCTGAVYIIKRPL